MKSIALVALLMLSLGGAGEALAGGHGNGCGYYGCGGGYYYPRAHARPYYPYAGYPYYGHHNNNNNSNSNVAYAIGGLALGAILMNVYSHNRAPNYTQQQTYQAPPAPQGRHLVRDLNGNCYERTTDAAGNELRTELPPSACNW
jgi:hypothetical protein